MKLRSSLVFALLLSAAFCATASAAEYSLNKGVVHFSTPNDWSVMIAKTSGDPQLYAFQVPNPHAKDTLTRVAVSTHQVANRAAFDALLNAARNKAGNLPNYHDDAPKGTPSSTLRYSADQDGETMRYRQSFQFQSNMAVEVRCVSPRSNPAPASWKRAYQHACDAIAAQLAN